MFSILIPTYSPTEGLAQMALDLCKQLRPFCDELIVNEDTENYWPELQKISDIYLMHKNLGFTKNVNMGLRVASGDFIAVVNSDVKYLEGNVRDLCKEGYVTSPECVDMVGHPALYGGFFVLPRQVIKDYGYLNEVHTHYGSDTEYARDVRKIFIAIPSVKITHKPGKGVSYKYREEVLGENI